MDKPIRVLVANRPRLIRELILTTFTDQPDIEVVGQVTNEADILESVEKTNPDFILIAQDSLGSRPNVCDIVFRLYPNVRIIAVAANQKYSVHYWASLAIHSHDVEPSEEGILGVLRSKPAPESLNTNSRNNRSSRKSGPERDSVM
jgi:chemotaxis response regulator CheB